MTTRLMWVRRKGAGFMPSHRCDRQNLTNSEDKKHLGTCQLACIGHVESELPLVLDCTPLPHRPSIQLLRIEDGQIDQTTLWSFISDFLIYFRCVPSTFFFAWSPHSLQDLSSPSRIESGPPQWKHWVLTSGLPGNSLHLSFIQFLCKISLVYCLRKSELPITTKYNKEGRKLEKKQFFYIPLDRNWEF